MKLLLRDVRYSARMLVKNPGFTIVAILTLTVGIGANTAIFSVVDAVLLRSLPYRDPNRLVWVSGVNAKNDIKDEAVSAPDFIDWRDGNHSFEDMAALEGFWGQLPDGDEPETVMAGSVTSNYFSVLGVMPRIGRNFTAEDAQPGKDNVIIVSDGFWKSRLGGDPKAMGRTITLGNRAVAVVGVMPSTFVNARPFDYKPMQIWKPMRLVSDNTERRNDGLGVIGRLKPGVTIENARADLNGVAESLERLYPETNTGWRANVVSLHDRFAGNVRGSLLALTSAVGFLLLIACANVANLFLARTAARQKELAVRAALGAGRFRLIQHMLTESVLLSLIGGVLGILAAWWGVRAMIALSPKLVPLGNVTINLSVLCFALLASVLTGLLFGSLPSIRASSTDFLKSLKEGVGTSSEGIGGRRVRDMLAAVEIALALMLLIGAGLMIRSFIRLQRVDPGFRTRNLLVASILATPNRYRDKSQVNQFYEDLISQVSLTPGVAGASVVSVPPLLGDDGFLLAFRIEGKPVRLTEKTPDAEYATCSPGYFRMMGIALIGGRGFNHFDTPNSEQVVAINQTMARRYWPNQDPIGKRINTGGGEANWRRIVGVVGDTHTQGLSVPAYSQIYAPIAQDSWRAVDLIVRTGSDPANLAGGIKARIRSVDKSQTFWVFVTMDSMIADLIAPPRFNMLLMLALAIVAAIIACVGIYGVVSFSVAQRTREIGIRMAVGATKQSVLRLVVGQGAAVTLIGLAAGLAGALAVARLMSSLLFSVTATDPATFLGVAVLLGVVSLAAAYLPARRATRVDPLVELRCE